MQTTKSFLQTLMVGFSLCCVIPRPAVFAGDWPQWRGPALNGSSLEKGLPDTLDRNKSLLWSAPLPGHSGATPVISGNHIFVASPDENKTLRLLALDRKSGKPLWDREVSIGDRSSGRNNMASPSPVTDGQRVFALFGTGDIAAFDFQGNTLWTRNLAREHGKFAIMWLYGSSPLLFEGRLYLQILQRNTPGDYPHAIDDKPQRESFLLCLDPATGKDLWRSVRKTDSTKESQEAYTTPYPYVHEGRKEILIVGGDHISGHDPLNGSEFWRARLYEKRDDWYRIVTSPVANGDLIYASGPKGQPLVAFKAGGKGDVTSTHVAWSSKEGHTDWSTPLIYQGKLFVLDGNKKTLSAFQPKTGEKLWSGSLGVLEPVWSSPTGADGKIYLVSEKGTALVLEAGDQFRLISKSELGGDPVRSSVVAAHGQLFIRTGKELLCFGNR